MNNDYNPKLYREFLSLMKVDKTTAYASYLRSDGIQVFTVTWRNLLGLDVHIVFNMDTYDFWPVYGHIRTSHVNGFVKLNIKDIPMTLTQRVEEFYRDLPKIEEDDRNIGVMNQWLAQYVITYGEKK